MDLERLAGPEAAADLLRWYREFSAEAHPESLAEHYVAYRAQVRAKVACLRAAQGDATAAAAAAEHLARCADHLARARVRLVLVGGPPGAGKSTIAAALADATGWAVLRADEVRKEIVGLPAVADATAEFGAGIYTDEVTGATYSELLARAARLAGLGETVVLDASWTSARDRGAARAVAAAASTDVHELCVDAPESVASARIAGRRARGGDPSDATVDVARRLRRRAEPWPEATVLDGAAPLAETVRAALRATA
jgi:predicted kinase